MHDPSTRAIVRATLVALVTGAAFGGQMPPALASPGDLDPTFGEGGVVTTSFAQEPTPSHYGAYAYAVAVQPDGKIVAGGWAGPGGPEEFALARYGRDGRLDVTFGDDGEVTTDFGDGSDEVGELAFQSDGKIIAVGAGRRGVAFGIARYEPDGTLDATFSGNGKVTTRFSVGVDHASAIALQADGKIVVAGTAGIYFAWPSPSGAEFALVRYNPDGTRDTTFSGDGRTTTNFTPGFDSVGRVTIQADGTIVAAGIARGSRKIALASYNPDGTLDTTFGDGGTKISAFVPGARVSAIAIQPDDRIVAAGFIDDGATLALARYNPDGTPDTTFSGDGKTTQEITDGRFLAYDAAIQPDGKIVLAGEGSGPSYYSAFVLARYDPDGALDATFGVDGFAVTDFSPHFDLAYAVAIQSDGKIVAAGTAEATYFALSRYLPT